MLPNSSMLGTFNTRLELLLPSLTVHHSPDRFSEGVPFGDKCFMPQPSSLDGRPGGDKPSGDTGERKDDQPYRVRKERQSWLGGGDGACCKSPNPMVLESGFHSAPGDI